MRAIAVATTFALGVAGCASSTSDIIAGAGEARERAVSIDREAEAASAELGEALASGEVGDGAMPFRGASGPAPGDDSGRRPGDSAGGGQGDQGDGGRGGRDPLVGEAAEQYLDGVAPGWRDIRTDDDRGVVIATPRGAYRVRDGAVIDPEVGAGGRATGRETGPGRDAGQPGRPANRAQEGTRPTVPGGVQPGHERKGGNVMDGIALVVIDIYTGVAGVVAPFLAGWVARGGQFRKFAELVNGGHED